MIPINDEETLNKENISIKDFIKNFDLGFQNMNNLKEKIENEIKEINLSYDKANEEATKFFELKHEKLIKEEKDMKDKLDTEVTKIKSKLEEYLSSIKELIRNYERIKKGINSLDKNEEENKNIKILKNLTYVSKINKNQKKMDYMTKLLMKNLKLHFIEENIKYEEYYFNGLPIPDNIQFSNIMPYCFNLSWNIKDLNLLNIDKNKIYYRVEIRKEKENFKIIYEGNNANYNINKLNADTTYELRICLLYEKISGIYSETKKVRTSKFDSLILNESKRCDEFLNIIYEWTGGKNMELLYRGTRDGMSADVFHNKCNNKGPTISLYKNGKGYIFGGYSSIDWTGCNENRKAPGSFIFTLTNIYDLAPTKFPNLGSYIDIYDYSSSGPCFGSGRDIAIDFSFNGTGFPSSFKDVLGKGKSIFQEDKNSNNNKFTLNEIEVFKLIK